MNTGALRQRVTVQVLSEAKDPYGQMVQSWADSGTYWAEVRNLSGREAVNAKQIKAEATHQVTMRYDGGLFAAPGLLPSMRLVFKGRDFNLLFINNVDERNREYQILAQEIVSPNPS